MEAQELLSQADETILLQGCDQPCYGGPLALGLDEPEQHLVGLFIESLPLVLQRHGVDGRVAQGPAGPLQRATHLLPLLGHGLGKLLVVVWCDCSVV